MYLDTNGGYGGGWNELPKKPHTDANLAFITILAAFVLIFGVLSACAYVIANNDLETHSFHAAVFCFALMCGMLALLPWR